MYLVRKQTDFSLLLMFFGKISKNAEEQILTKDDLCSVDFRCLCPYWRQKAMSLLPAPPLIFSRPCRKIFIDNLNSFRVQIVNNFFAKVC